MSKVAKEKQEVDDVPVNLRVSKVLKERYSRALAARGLMLSEALRAHMDEAATRYEEHQVQKDSIPK